MSGEVDWLTPPHECIGAAAACACLFLDKLSRIPLRTMKLGEQRGEVLRVQTTLIERRRRTTRMLQGKSADR